MQKTKHYIKPNVADRLFVVLLFAALSALVCRAAAFTFLPIGQNSCTAEVAFVIYGVEGDTLADLQDGTQPYDFAFADGNVLSATAFTVKPSEVVIEDEDGEHITELSPTKRDVTFSLSAAEGARAKDGTFLLGGYHRLATGEQVTLTRGGEKYQVTFTKVSISS